MSRSSPVSGPSGRSMLTALLLAAGAACAQAAPAYTLLDLGTLTQAQAPVVRRPNSQGQAGVGGREVGAGVGGRRGLVLEPGAGARRMPGPGGGDEAATVFGINDDGAYVGSANTATAVRAFAGSRSGAVRELAPLPGDNASVAFGINSLGQAVGFSSGPNGERAVVWDTSGTPSALPALDGATATRANDISSGGDVAGVATLPAGRQPVLWLRGQAPRSLDLIGGDTHGEAVTVNARGEAVGYTGDAAGRVRHAAAWAPDGEATSLGGLPGGPSSEALGTNDAGAVVGTAGGRAFLWTREGGMRDLNDLVAPSRLVLTRATGINNAGAILVLGHEGGAHGHDAHAGHTSPVRVFLLRPAGP